MRPTTALSLFLETFNRACSWAQDMPRAQALVKIRESCLAAVRVAYGWGLLTLKPEDWVIVVSGQANGDTTVDYTPRVLYDRPDISTVATDRAGVCTSSCSVGGVAYIGTGDCGFTALEDLARVLTQAGVLKTDKPAPAPNPKVLPEAGEVWMSGPGGTTCEVIKVTLMGAFVTFRASDTGDVEHHWPVSLFLKGHKRVTGTTLHVGSRSFYVGQVLNCKDGSSPETSAPAPAPAPAPEALNFNGRRFHVGQILRCADGTRSEIRQFVPGYGETDIVFRDLTAGDCFRWSVSSFAETHPE